MTPELATTLGEKGLGLSSGNRGYVSEKQKLKNSDYPLIARILQGPCEQISKVFLMEKDQVEEVTYDVSPFAWWSFLSSGGGKQWRGRRPTVEGEPRGDC